LLTPPSVIYILDLAQAAPKCLTPRWASSSPGEFHPQALTEPDMTVSRHPALIIPSQLSDPCLTVWLLPLLVDQKVKLDDPTPSLHPHYGTSSLLRIGPPLCPASVLSPSWVLHLDFSLHIGTTDSQVPYKSLNQIRAAYMPDATQAVNRFLLG
jgi:hypothetical protein